MFFFNFSEIKNNIRIFKHYIYLELRNLYEYPLNFAVGIFWGVLSLIPAYFFWAIIFSKVNIANYDLTKMMLYYLFIQGLHYSGGMFNNIRRSIVQGDILKILTKKMTLELHFIFSIISTIIQINFLNIFIVTTIGLYFIGINALLGIVFFLFGLAIGSIVYSIVISMSFWTGESWGLFSVLGFIIGMCAGHVIPLDLFPKTLQTIFYLLPFNLMFYTPAKIFLGDIKIGIWLIATYVIWIIILYIILKIIIYFGLKRYEQLGG